MVRWHMQYLLKWIGRDVTERVNLTRTLPLWESHGVWPWLCIVHRLVPPCAIVTHTPSSRSPSTRSSSRHFLMPSPTPLTTPHGRNPVYSFVRTWAQIILVEVGDELVTRARNHLIAGTAR